MAPRFDIDRLDNRDPAYVARVADALEPLLDRWFRPEVRGLDRVPETGPVLYVGNHSGGLGSFDTFIWICKAYRQRGLDAVPYGLAHEVAISWPVLNELIVPLGAVRASHDNARRLFEAGHRVLVYPGGDLDSMRPFRHRDRVVFGPRRGYVRLALRQGVPIVPVVASGSHSTFVVLDDGRWLARRLGLPRRLRLEVFPITLSVPWGLTLGITPPYVPLPTRVLVELLPPVTFDRTGEDAAADDAYVERCHERVHAQMESTLRRLSRERRADRG